MKATNKRLLSMLLTLSMVFTMLPAALAEGPENENSNGQETTIECACNGDTCLGEACEVCKTDPTQCKLAEPAAPVDPDAEEEEPVQQEEPTKPTDGNSGNPIEDEANKDIAPIAENAVAEVNGTEYDTLAEAIEAAQDGATVPHASGI